MTVLNFKTDFGAAGGGADASSAIDAMITYGVAQGTSLVEVLIPADDYVFGNPRFTFGIQDIIVYAYGATVDQAFIGGADIYEDKVHSARIETVTPGATMVRLKTLGDASIFSIGDGVMSTAVQLQTDGFPPNWYNFEPAIITGISGKDITIDRKLLGDYKDTYPLVGPTSSNKADFGGPATLQKLKPSWNCRTVVKGLTVLNGSDQQLIGGREALCEDVTWGAGGVAMGGGDRHVLRRCHSGAVEIDKQVNVVEFDRHIMNSGNLTVQSPANLVILSGVTAATVNGTGKRMVIRNGSNIGSLRFHPTGYGVSSWISIRDSNVTTIIAGALSVLLSDLTYLGDGVFRFANGGTTLGDGQAKLVPGGNYVFGDNVNFGMPFQCTDLTQDATYTYVHTTLTGGSLPTLVGPGAVTPDRIVSNSMPHVFASNCTGAAAGFNAAYAQGKAALSYASGTYTFGAGQAGAGLTAIGELVSITWDITKAYSGAQGSLKLQTAQFNNVASRHPDGTFQNFGPTIDLKQTGTVVMTPTGVTGSRAEDTFSPASPVGLLWFESSFSPYCDHDISGETSDKWPSVTITIETDQGIVGKVFACNFS